MLNQNADPGFEKYRRDRQRRSSHAAGSKELPAHAGARKQLELAEQREVREQQMAREVHDFFESATKTAASIVQRVSESAKTEMSERISQEMQEFLVETLERMNGLILGVIGSNPGVSQTEVLPQMQNLVGPLLDQFRSSVGASQVGTLHLGEDPFATEVSAVADELAEVADTTAQQVGDIEVGRDRTLTAQEIGNQGTDIEEHLVAQLAPKAAEIELPADPPEPAPAPAKAKAASTGDPELDKFKETLKGLVRQGLMSREEARAAWVVRTQKTGR